MQPECFSRHIWTVFVGDWEVDQPTDGIIDSDQDRPLEALLPCIQVV